MALWLAKEFDWDTGRYTGRYYDIAEAGIVAKFVDIFYGDDSTGDGSSSNPYKTLGAAITDLNSTGADGSRIFMNGIFSETMPSQTYNYEFIGCGGGKNGRTLFNKIGTNYPRFAFNSKYHNIETLNYDHETIGERTLFIVNCFLRFISYGAHSTNNALIAFYCIFYDIITRRLDSLANKAEKCIFYKVTTSYNQAFVTSNHKNNYYFNCINHIGNPMVYTNESRALIVDVYAHFINVNNYDFNVRITSPLLGAGTVDEITGIAANVGGVEVGLPYNGITPDFTTEGGATITDLTIDANGKITITAPATTGTLETALMDLGNIYPLENIDLFNLFDFAAGEITQGVFEDFVSPRMALTIKLKYGLTSAEVDDCPWLLIEYGKQPTFSGTGASRVGNADDTFDPDTFQEITCRYMKLFVTLQNNS